MPSCGVEVIQDLLTTGGMTMAESFYLIPEEGSCQTCCGLGRICDSSQNWDTSKKCLPCEGTGRVSKTEFVPGPRQVEAYRQINDLTSGVR